MSPLLSADGFYHIQLEAARKTGAKTGLDLFRQANGVLSESADQIEAYLLRTVNYPPAREKIVNGLLTQINGKDPKIPDDRVSVVAVALGSKKTGLQIAIVP